MNKAKATKTINALINNFEDAKTINNRLYVETWVIGSLKEINLKLHGDYYYEIHRYTYRELFEDFYKHFTCKNISEHIENETKSRLLTSENVELVKSLKSALGLKGE